MKLSFLFAKRYLIAKKTHNAINIISMVSLCGVAIISMALICTLSVYNGFQDLIASLYSNFDSELRIEPARGKFFAIDQPIFDDIRSMPEIDTFGEVIQEQVLINYGERQVPALFKGVDSTYQALTQIDQLIVNGTFTLQDPVAEYVNVGIGLASQLQVNAGFVRPLELFVPKRIGKINLSNPTQSFTTGHVFVASVFAVNQAKYDDYYLIGSLPFARQLFEAPKQVSSIELKLQKEADLTRVETQLEQMLGDDYLVLNRMEQQADSFRIMQIEKWMTFLILLFILIIASFNVIGSLSMLIVDKKNDIITLRNMGASTSFIRRIFLIEGILISGIGAVVGIGLGVILCYLQQEFGLLRMGDASGIFIIDSYPVKLQWQDVVSVVGVVSVLGYLTALYPVHTMIRQSEP